MWSRLLPCALPECCLPSPLMHSCVLWVLQSPSCGAESAARGLLHTVIFCMVLVKVATCGSAKLVQGCLEVQLRCVTTHFLACESCRTFHALPTLMTAGLRTCLHHTCNMRCMPSSTTYFSGAMAVCLRSCVPSMCVGTG